MLKAIWLDVRHGARMLLKSPGFALMAVVSIAFGVGANAAMFSLADGLVLRPLPVPRPGEIVTVSAVAPGVGFGNPRLSYPDYVDLRAQTTSLDGLVAYGFVVTSFAHRTDEPVLRKVGMAVSANLFEAMEVRPTLGRTFRPDEDQVAGRDAVVILDHDEWHNGFAADPAIVDRRIRIGGREFTIVGVAPAGFTGIDHDVHPAFYVPLAMEASVQSGAQADAMTRRDVRGLVVKGRLKPGASVTQARADVQHVAATLERSHPDTNRNMGLTVRTQLDAFNQGPSIDTQLVAMLLVLAAMVLIVACANVAGLLASRAPAWAPEFALRLAIGAGRARLIRQLVTESLLLAAGGGALGLVLGYGAIALFQQLEFPTDVPLKLTFALDMRVVVVGIAAAAASALLSSVIPAWQATRADLVTAIKERAAGAAAGSRLWGRSTLVCGQVALSLVLLTVSVFLYRAFNAELSQGPGFRTTHLVMMALDPTLARYDGPKAREFYRLLTERVRAVPGVASVALTTAVPMKADTMEVTAVAPEGFQFPAGTTNVNIAWARVDDGFFDTIGIPIVKGRGVLATDTESTAHIAVVNRTFAAHYWPGQEPIGKRFRLDDGNDDRELVEVVGVAADAKNFFIAEAPTEFFYVPRAQHWRPQSLLLVQTRGVSAAMVAPLREAVRRMDPNMPVFGIRTMEDFYFSRAVHVTRLIVGSVSAMGTMGLVLAMVGLYGLVAYTTGRRTREIGIRMAVGARPGSVLRMVLRRGALLSATGIVLGVAGSAATSRLLESVFPSERGLDLSTYLVVIPALAVITLLAAYIPARRAAHINPVTALRAE